MTDQTLRTLHGMNKYTSEWISLGSVSMTDEQFLQLIQLTEAAYGHARNMNLRIGSTVYSILDFAAIRIDPPLPEEMFE